jgi:colanic acid/amylovoran biosynthesis glycosyltransferase
MNDAARRPRLAIVQPNPVTPSETFLQAQAERLPAAVTVWSGLRPRAAGQASTLGERLRRHAWRAARWFGGHSLDWEVTQTFSHELRRRRYDLVLAQYGPTGVRVMDACRAAGTPLVVHFHGYDASHRATLQQYTAAYPLLFRQAGAVVAVSRAMRQQLIELGAPADKVHLCPYGVDPHRIGAAQPAAAPPVFLAVGRLIPKKAPLATIEAFAAVRRQHPEAQLRMVGDGQLLPQCRQLVADLQLGGAVCLLGAQPHAVVLREMASARAFVQHSVVSPDGDSEGTPVAILEASASGLPVVSTRHAGIPDVVAEGRTGLLVAEHDVAGMAAHMRMLLENPARAVLLGSAGRAHVLAHYTLDQSIARLWSVLASCLPAASRQAA